nr:MAG TPA: hypothetical protein [Caudoviricetes sp.]
MKGYKGFNPDFTCKEKQYRENEIFEEDCAKICEKGMHFCENPFDVLDYYDLIRADGTPNEFAEVEALDDPKSDDNRKFCTKKLKIGVKLGLSGFIKACVDFALEKTVGEMPSANVRSRYGAQIGSSRYGAQIGSSRDCAKIGSAGNNAQIGSSGDCAQIGSAGNNAQIGSSGYGAQIGSSGNNAKIGSSGYGAQIGSSGDGSKIGSSGDSVKINCTGSESVVCCAGNGSVVKASIGCWVTLAEWQYDVVKRHHVPVCVKTEYVDGNRIKADTPYMLQNGEFVEVVEP